MIRIAVDVDVRVRVRVRVRVIVECRDFSSQGREFWFGLVWLVIMRFGYNALRSLLPGLVCLLLRLFLFFLHVQRGCLS